MPNTFGHKSAVAHGVSDVPQGEHWVILGFRTITIPGDERSRTAPGHGYPESTETCATYEVFTDEETFKATLLTRYRQDIGTSEKHVGLHVSEVWRREIGVALAAGRKLDI